jgi:SAM-dependent methyltransferase
MFTESRNRAEVARVIDVAGLPLGARVLDCPSGQGRHAKLFAEAGLDVTALDYSQELLDEAGRGGGTPGMRLVRGDIRSLPSRWKGRFDAVVSLGASFGFFATPAEDEATIASYAAVIRPGGALVLHAANRDGIVAGFIEKDWWESEDSTLVLHEREFDPLSGMLTVRTTLRRGARSRRRAYRLRLYTATSLAAMCARHSLLVVGAYDGWRDRSLRRTSGEMLLHCVRLP